MESKNLTLAGNLILERAALEYRAGGSFVYCSQPFSCGVDEAVAHLAQYKGFIFPAGVMADSDTSKDGRATIKRGDRETVITVKPLPGSRMRKPWTLRLWA